MPCFLPWKGSRDNWHSWSSPRIRASLSTKLRMQPFCVRAYSCFSFSNCSDFQIFHCDKIHTP